MEDSKTSFPKPAQDMAAKVRYLREIAESRELEVIDPLARKLGFETAWVVQREGAEECVVPGWVLKTKTPLGDDMHTMLEVTSSATVEMPVIRERLAQICRYWRMPLFDAVSGDRVLPVGVLWVGLQGFSEEVAAAAGQLSMEYQLRLQLVDAERLAALIDAHMPSFFMPLLKDADFHGLLGRSPAMRAVFRQLERIAPTRGTVLIRGESGTGKELAARVIHKLSPRAAQSFVAVNAAAIPETLLETDMFGIERGVAPGVVQRRGKFEMADQGTLLLDEIGDISPAMQVRMLRLMEEGRFLRVGGSKPVKVDVRFIAASSRNLEQAVQEGRFREDLYHYLSALTVVMPPLRERWEDVPLLVEHFAATYSEEFARRVTGVCPEAMQVLLAYAWPGNVRELENAVERAVILARGDMITVKELLLKLFGADKTGVPSARSGRKSAGSPGRGRSSAVRKH